MGLEVRIDNKRDFEPVTDMIQPAILADVVDKGEVPNKFKPGTLQKKCMFVWILAEEDTEGRNKRVFEVFTQSLNEKARLRKRLADLGFKDFEPGVPFNLETVIGQKRLLVLAEEDSKEPGGKPFVKVTAVMPLKKGQQAPDVPADFVRAKDKPQQ